MRVLGAISDFSLFLYWEAANSSRDVRSAGRKFAIMPPKSQRTGKSAGKSKGVKKVTGQQASGVGSSQEMSPAQKRAQTMAKNKEAAEAARRGAGGDDPTEDELRAADQGRNQRGGDSSIAELQEKVRRLQELLDEKLRLDQTRSQLNEEEAVLTRRQVVLTAARSLSAAAPRGLNADRSVETSRSADRMPRAGVTDDDDCPITDPPAWRGLLSTVTRYVLRKLLLDFACRSYPLRSCMWHFRRS